MLGMALGNIFVERYADNFANTSSNERSEVARFVSAFGGGHDAPVAKTERVTQHLPDKVGNAIGKFLNHCIVALYVGQRPTIKRFLSERDDAELRILGRAKRLRR